MKIEFTPALFCLRILNMLCGPHQAEREASGLTLQEWAATRHNPLVLALQGAKKAHGGE